MNTLGESRCKSAAVLLIQMLLASSVTHAQMQVRSGVRADGMGGAYVAVSTDVNALQFAAAGLLNSFHTWQAQAGFHRLYFGRDFTYSTVGLVRNFLDTDSSKDKMRPRLFEPIIASADGAVLARPAPAPAQFADTTRVRYTIGGQIYNLSFPGQRQTTALLSVGAGFLPIRDSLMPNDEFPGHVANRLAVAVTGRYVNSGYDEGYLLDANEVNDAGELAGIERFLNANSVDVSAVALDASLALYLSHKLQVGVSILNLLQPNLAAKSKETGAQVNSGQFARRWRAGVAYRFLPNLITAVDVEKNPDAEALVKDVNVYAGAEYLWHNPYLPLALRSGANGNWISGGLGLHLARVIGQNLTINYVYQHSLHEQGFNNSRFALDFGIR